MYEEGHALAWRNDKWPWSSITQYAPDGKTVLGEMLFLICPTCFALVAQGPDDDLRRFRNGHADWHQSSR